ncbi:hypothetical protein EDD18DRAFT_1357743 [Armillaria luteobubalina]|uniref:Transmembrane protein n=1 Tax=Armillaria luteobubalina TaxID=153913 RepID=A0AA39PZA5_9AGAR|nr:hypothetical protein EDD18DRAFT_1357743 [Armillaria luteobubalina]
MPTDSLPAMKRIWCCFFSSMGFIIMVPVACIIFGKTLHPREFEYHALASSVDDGTRIVSIGIILACSDLKKGEAVLNWNIVDDSCYDNSPANCTTINIYFAINLLQQSYLNHSKPSNSNKPTDPTFIWNVTGYESDYYLDFPMFQTVDVYYPFDRYTAIAFCFAEDVSTNAPVKLDLAKTSGLVGGLKIKGNVIQEMSSDVPEAIIIEIDLQRGTLIKLYCIVITITFWLVTITICLLMRARRIMCLRGAFMRSGAFRAF